MTKMPKDKYLDWCMKHMPKFMLPNLDGVQTIVDLEYRVHLEIDLGENGSTDPRWTKKQLHRAKMYCAEVHIKAQQFELEYPELCDDLNHAEGD